ncbi:MAG: hypothetical protein QME71_02505 [Dehalococcoidia bacterium]|nr:hypothetical protein [Dehalococcoidia bacterium]
MFSNKNFSRPLRRLPVLGLALAFTIALAFAFAGCGGDGEGDEDAATVVERFLGLGQEPGTTIDVTLGSEPAGLPSGLPEYPGSSLLGSTVSETQGQKGYTVLRETSDSPDTVLLYFEEELEKDPWQVVLSTSVQGFAALQFTRIDDATFLGGVIVQDAGNGRSTILLSVQTLGGQTPETKPFEPAASKPLPRGFPAEVPLYPDMTVTETAWARSSSTTEFQVTFITKDLMMDVLDFYRMELTTRGWTVTDQADQTGGTALSFESTALGGTWSGRLTVAQFEEDPSYTRARLDLSIGAQGEQPSPSPTPAP